MRTETGLRSNFLSSITAADWLRPSVIALVLANLVPVFGVFFFHWEVFPLMFLFWSENVIIGAYNVLKMFVAKPASGVSWVIKLFIIPIFCFHYGLFTFVHGAFIVVLFGGGMKQASRFPDWPTFWTIVHENQLGWAIIALAVSRGISFATNYLGSGEFKRASLSVLMMQPYGRVILLHVVVLFGGMLMLALHSPKAGLLLLVALKTAFDLCAHVAERNKFAEPSFTS